MQNPMASFNLIVIGSIVGVIVWLASPNAYGAPASDLKTLEYEAEYKISWHGMTVGQSVHSLRKADEADHFELEVRSTPVLSFIPYHQLENVRYVIDGEQIKPEQYYYTIAERKKKKVGNVIFDWENGRVGNQAGSGTWSTPLHPGVLDKLTHSLQLREDLRLGKQTMRYWVVEDDEMKPYTFNVMGEETVQTALGAVETLKVKHISRSGRETVFWMAPALEYLPVKLNQYRKGKKVGTGEITHLTVFDSTATQTTPPESNQG